MQGLETESVSYCEVHEVLRARVEFKSIHMYPPMDKLISLFYAPSPHLIFDT